MEPYDQEEAEVLEQEHFEKVLNAFKSYQALSMKILKRQEANFFTERNEKYLKVIEKEIKEKFAASKVAIEANQAFFNQIIQPHQLFQNYTMGGEPSCEHMEAPHEHGHSHSHSDHAVEGGHSHSHSHSHGDSSASPPFITESDMDKVRCTLRQFVRDWSDEGQVERAQCYGFILEELKTFFKDDPRPKNQIGVLTPGGGLGRLAFEIAKAGFKSQGNEFSYYMLLASNFILNRSAAEKQFTIFPFVHQTSNVVNPADALRPVQIPDTNPADLPSGSDFSMTAGDFLEVYGAQPGEWDSVVTCFFIDTAHNVFEYLETIYKTLKPGGLWVNYGPLLYHFADMANEYSIELSYSELRKMIVAVGFEIVKEEVKSTTYTGNKRSMMQVVYKCAFFTCRKK